MAGFSNGALTVDDVTTSRNNLGLGTSSSPTFATVTATTQVLTNSLGSTAANTSMSIGAGLSTGDTATLTLYTNGVGKVLVQSTANTTSSAIDLQALTGGINLTAAANKDITLGTSGTGKVSATSITATTFTGALAGNASTATTLQTARNINGTSFNGSADITIPVNTTSSTTNAAFYPLFVPSSSNGNQSVNLGTGLTFNPSTNALGTSIMQADSFRNYTTNPTTVTLSNTGTSTNSSSVYVASNAGGITIDAANGVVISPGAGKVSSFSSGTVLALGLTVSSAGAVTAPTLTTQLNISSATQSSARIVLSGQEFYQAANTSTDGLAILLGVNRSSDRQMWIGRSDALTPNSTNPIIRFAPLTDAASGSYIDSIGTDGSTAHILRVNPSGGAVKTGSGLFTAGGALTVTGLTTASTSGVQFTNSTSGYVIASLDYFERATAVSATSSGAVTQTFTAKLTRIGNVVTMIWPDFNWTVGSASTLTVSSLIPARFRPTATVNLNYFMKNFGTNSVSTFSISSAGTAVFGCNASGGSFSAGTNSFAIYGGCQSWTID